MGHREVWQFILEYVLSTAGLEFLSLTDLKAYSSSGGLFDDFGGHPPPCLGAHLFEISQCLYSGGHSQLLLQLPVTPSFFFLKHWALHPSSLTLEFTLGPASPHTAVPASSEDAGSSHTATTMHSEAAHLVPAGFLRLNSPGEEKTQSSLHSFAQNQFFFSFLQNPPPPNALRTSNVGTFLISFSW